MKECAVCFSDIFDDALAVCPRCGAPLGAKRKSASPQIPATSNESPAILDEEVAQFQRQFEDRGIYLPGKIYKKAQEILQSAATEMRRATVILADMRGFSRLGRQMTPEELHSVANEFYRICSECILRRGGFIVEFVGDAVVAVFGAPVAFDHDTESAVRAAVDILAACRQNSDAQRPLSIRIGIATGKIQSGTMEAPFGKIFHIIGDTINLAARLQTAAATDEILVCAQTYETVSRAFVAEPTPPLSLKNMEEGYVAYKIFSEKEKVEPLRHFDTPFCARENELGELTALFASTRRKRTAHIVGEAGIGKSRLVHEVLHRSGLEPAAIKWNADPSSAAILLHPVICWLREEMDIRICSAPSHLQKSVEQYIRERGMDTETDPLLLEFLFGVPEAIEAMRGIPPERIQRNLFGLLRQMIVSHARKTGGVILVVDDVQWLDSLTKRFIAALADWPSDAEPLTLILLYRSGAEPPISLSPSHLVINLEPLNDEERHILIKKLSPVEDFFPEIRKIVLSRAAGNPLFMEEMMRIIQEVARNNAHLNGEILVNRIIEVIPVSLHELIQSRIDRLDSRSRQVLQCASILGLEFAFSLIEMFDIIRDGLTAHLQSLRAMRYLEELPEPEDIKYFFTHGLFRDVVYSTLLEEQKKRLHASLARRLESVFAEKNMPEYHELLAFHFSRGGETQKAVYYLTKAADRQAGLGGASNAAQNYAEAIELLRGMPPDESRQTLMARLLQRAGCLQILLGNMDQAEEMIRGALDLAEALGNARLALEARMELAGLFIWLGKNDEAQEILERVLREAVRLEMPHVECIALNSLGVVEWRRGNLENALKAFRKLASLAGKNSCLQQQADAFNNAGLIYWRWGQHAQALKAYKRAVPLRRKAGDNFGLCAALLNIGIIQEQMGEIGAARKSYEKARALAEKTGYAQGLAAIESTLSNFERRVGTLSAALERAQRALQYARESGDPNIEASVEQNIGLAFHALGNTSEARAHYQRSLELAKEHKNLEYETMARLSLVEATISEGKIRYEDEWECNAILQIIELQKYRDLLSRLYRVKGEILDILNERNSRTAREYLEMSRDVARSAGNALDERDALRTLLAFASRHNIAEDSERWRTDLTKIEQGILSSTSSGNG